MRDENIENKISDVLDLYTKKLYTSDFQDKSALNFIEAVGNMHKTYSHCVSAADHLKELRETTSYWGRNAAGFLIDIGSLDYLKYALKEGSEEERKNIRDMVLKEGLHYREPLLVKMAALAGATLPPQGEALLKRMDNGEHAKVEKMYNSDKYTFFPSTLEHSEGKFTPSELKALQQIESYIAADINELCLDKGKSGGQIKFLNKHDKIFALVEDYRKSPNQFLATAIDQNDALAFEIALKRGATGDGKLPEYSHYDNSFQIAVAQNKLEMAEKLWNPNLKIDTPIQRYQKEYSNMVAYMLMETPSLSKEALDYLISKGNREDLTGATIRHKNNDTQSEMPILHALAGLSYADYEDQSELIDHILKKNYPINKKDANGNTAAVYAAHAMNLNALKTLVQHGADLDMPMHFGDGKKVRIIDWLYEKDGNPKNYTYRSYHPDETYSLLPERTKKMAKDKEMRDQKLKEIYEIHKANKLKNCVNAKNKSYD